MGNKMEQPKKKGTEQAQQKPKSPLRASQLLENAIEKRIAVNIQTMTGQVIEKAIPLNVERYEITFLYQGKLLVLYKHAIHSLEFSIQAMSFDELLNMINIVERKIIDLSDELSKLQDDDYEKAKAIQHEISIYEKLLKYLK